MRSNLRTFIISLLLFIPFHISCEEHIFISFPKSGAHWTMYTMRHLTGRSWYVMRNPTGKALKPNTAIYGDFGLPQNFDKPFLIHTHEANIAETFNSKEDKLVLILRNYKESFIRRYRDPQKLLYSLSMLEKPIGSLHPKQRKESKDLRKYFANIQLFDEWLPTKRLLIRYENLLVNPKRSFRQIIDFLGEPKGELDPFFNNLEYHRETCIAMYDLTHRYGSPSQSKGKGTDFHSKNVSRREKQQIDAKVQQLYPTLWDKYLKVYQTL